MLFYFVVMCVSAAHAQNLQVSTTEGVIQGVTAPDGNYTAFYGIPYAGSTAGENRFKAPTPPSPYPGVFHAIDSGILCAQPTTRGLIGVENCLTLNIFTKNVTTPKPVFVWLNAEEFTTANNQLYSFKSIVEADIVVVSLNFRLSIFGFLCLGVPEAPGNAGLKDVIQGLKWIKANIVGFGGDPNNVVLVGHGSGAVMADLITLSRKSDNLVSKAIAMSGSALAPWAIAYQPLKYAETYARRLSYSGKTPTELANLLKNTDINVLGSSLNDFEFTNNSILFAPCIENFNSNDTVLIDVPLNILRSGNYSSIPFISTYTNREGTLRAGQAAFGQWLDRMQANFTDFLQVDLDFGTNKTAMSQAIRNLYFGNTAISMATIQDYLEYHGDTLVLVSVLRGTRERSLTSSREVRLLEFSYRGTSNSDWAYNQIPLTGVKHGGILNYLFDYDLLAGDEVAKNAIISRFATFAYTGIPQPTVNSTQWDAITKDTFYYFYMTGENPSTNITSIYSESSRFNPHASKMSLNDVNWNDIYSRYYVAPKSVSSADKILSVAFLVILCQLVNIL